MVRLITAFVTLFICVVSTSPAFAILRLKNFREVYASLASSLAVNPKDPQMLAALVQVQDRLPREGSTAEFSSPTLMALTELSGVFCGKSIAIEKLKPSGERFLFPEIDFQKGPQSINSFFREKVIERLSVSLWLRNPEDNEKELLKSFLDSLILKSPNSNAETVKVMQLLCTHIASSLPFVIK